MVFYSLDTFIGLLLISINRSSATGTFFRLLESKIYPNLGGQGIDYVYDKLHIQMQIRHFTHYIFIHASLYIWIWTMTYTGNYKIWASQIKWSIGLKLLKCVIIVGMLTQSSSYIITLSEHPLALFLKLHLASFCEWEGMLFRSLAPDLQKYFNLLAWFGIIDVEISTGSESCVIWIHLGRIPKELGNIECRWVSEDILHENRYRFKMI